MTAWHLSEWIFWEFEKQNFTNHQSQKKNVREFQDRVIAICPSIKLMNDIADGSKHYKLNSSRGIKTKMHGGSFSQAFSRAFDISVLLIIHPDGTELYFEDEIEKAVNFWKDYFVNRGIPVHR